MNVNVEKLEGSRAKLTITVDKETFAKSRDAAYKKNKNKISMPGFRKGKVPRKMIERMYGKNVFDDDAMNMCAPDAYKEAADGSDLDIISSPEFDVVEVTDDGEFIFEATVAVKPEVKLGLYEGIEVAARKVRILKKDVDAELERVREQNARMVEVTDRPIKDGDIAKIDFEGFVDGEAFEGGKGENYDLVIGSHSFIDNFEDQLIGKSIGDDVDVNVTFPEEYHQPELKGKPALFKVHINGITEKELPKLDDEFAEEVSEFSLLEDYKKDIKKNLKEKREAEAKAAREQEAVEKAVANCTVDLPKQAVDTQVEEMAREFAYRLQMQGMRIDQYMQMTGLTTEKLLADMRPEAENRLKTRFVLEAIVEAENIEVTDEEVDKEIENVATMYGQKPEDYKKDLTETDLKNMRLDLGVKKAAEFICDHADNYWKADDDVEKEDAENGKEEEEE
ncbi:MAG: trigger factor [Eubacterium sp.]|nr:trigger factor [Eubacterium sp.]